MEENHNSDQVVISTELVITFLIMSVLFVILAFFVAKSIYIQDIESHINPIQEQMIQIDSIQSVKYDMLYHELETIKRENNNILIRDTVYVKHLK